MGDSYGSRLRGSGREQGGIERSGQERRGSRGQGGSRYEESDRGQNGRQVRSAARYGGRNQGRTRAQVGRRQEESVRWQSDCQAGNAARYRGRDQERTRAQVGRRQEESSRRQSDCQAGGSVRYRRDSQAAGVRQVRSRSHNERRQKRARVQAKRRRRMAVKRFALCAAMLAMGMWMIGVVKETLLSGNLNTAQAQRSTGAAGSGGTEFLENGNPDSGELPEILRELLEKNEETLDYVQSYPDREKYKSQSIDITGDFVSGEVPLLMQWDKRWGYDAYGSEMIGLAGCGPLCLEMAYLYFTGDTDMTPREMADFAYENGFYTEQGTSWSLWTEGAARLGLKGAELSLDENVMKDSLDAGRLIVCSMRPGDFTTTGHFILIRGYDEDGFLVNDPNRRSTSGKTWSYEEIQYQIRNLWSLGKD